MSNLDYTSLSELDFTKIDYNKLTPQEFMLLEKQAQRLRVINKNTRRTGKDKRYLVRIYGNIYSIDKKTFEKLKMARSKKGIDSIKAEIASRFSPLSEVIEESNVEPI